jgi:hypothetical protein
VSLGPRLLLLLLVVDSLDVVDDHEQLSACGSVVFLLDQASLKNRLKQLGYVLDPLLIHPSVKDILLD